ncbi:two-component sensor molecule [Phaffia rhodozyma]|uniref:Two-component sensor molecule n=1 Tax=Phaffia rhodozyma TaxID=264483 RepID=A0A0F7SLG5_PHARH|nr:two-component sensor molecule [Phaffia rhodozyma]
MVDESFTQTSVAPISSSSSTSSPPSPSSCLPMTPNGEMHKVPDPLDAATGLSHLSGMVINKCPLSSSTCSGPSPCSSAVSSISSNFLQMFRSDRSDSDISCDYVSPSVSVGGVRSTKGADVSSSDLSGLNTGSTDDQKAHQNFTNWLNAYAAGKVPACVLPPKSKLLPTVHEDSVPPPYSLQPRDVDEDPTVEESTFVKRGWLPAPFPPNETERRKALYRFGLINRESFPNDPAQRGKNPVLEKAIRLARKIFNVPSAMTVLIDEVDMPILASAGYENTKYDRVGSTCAHTILFNEPHVILDCMADWRFQTNHPQTSGPAPLRFYAGTQLKTADGFHLGSFCILDTKPRTEFSDEDKGLLQDLSDMVMRELEHCLLEKHMARTTILTASVDRLTREVASAGDLADPSNLVTVYDIAARTVRETLNVDQTVIFDISAFQYLKPNLSLSSAGSYSFIGPDNNAHFSLTPSHVDSLPIMSQSTQPHSSAHSALLPPTAFLPAKLCEFLIAHPTGRVFSSTEIPTWLGYRLPEKTRYLQLQPVLNMNKSAVALIATLTSNEAQAFLDVECQFIRAVEGAILWASVLRSIQGADHAKFGFISNMSHELRTPLHGILASTELLSDTPLDPRQQTHLNTIKLCGANLSETILSVLDFTKSSSSTMGATPKNSQSSTELSVVNLADFIEETAIAVCASHQFSQAQRNQMAGAIGSLYCPRKLSSDINIDPNETPVEVLLDFGSKDFDTWNVKIDKGAVRRAVVNLLTNALKYTSKGYVKISVSSPTPVNDHPRVFIITVSDSGIGMSASFIKDHLFAPFTQENSFVAGAGLGLAITQQIVQNMNGQIDVCSVQGEGSSFKITVPLEILEPNPPRLPPIGLNQTICLLGFSPDTRRIFRTLLKEWKFKINKTERGSDVLLLDDSVSRQQVDNLLRFYRVLQFSSNWLDSNRLRESERHQILEKPCGPRKLYRAITKIFNETSISSKSLDSLAEIPPQTLRVDKCVLIVEDNIVNRSVLRVFLSRKGVKYLEAADGKEGAEIFKSQPPGSIFFVIMDLQMPVMDGYASASEIRKTEETRRQLQSKENPSGPIVNPVQIYALTGSSSLESKRKASEAGMQGFLVKPIALRQLWTHVEDAMASS